MNSYASTITLSWRLAPYRRFGVSATTWLREAPDMQLPLAKVHSAPVRYMGYGVGG